MVRIPSVSSRAFALGPMPFTFRTGRGQIRAGTSPSVSTVRPPGLSSSEAIFDKSLFGVMPIEHESPVASRTARWMSVAITRARTQESGAPSAALDRTSAVRSM